MSNLGDLWNNPNLTNCPKCDGTSFESIETPGAIHYAKLQCKCGRWLKWLPYPDGVGSYLYNIHDEWYFNFGKHNKEKVADNPKYVDWMTTQDFPKAVMDIVTTEV